MRAFLMAAFLWWMALPALAQMTATLVADRVDVTADNRLIASGNVTAFYDGTTLSAARITYDQATDRLTIDGPIFVQATDGTILTADAASLDPQLQNGLLRGARLVLNQQLQLAANSIARVDGRYSALAQVAATSCNICGNRAPLWEIRARQVIHDAEARQLYFDNATFRVAGVPILWLPRMRLPDPTLTRATGFLIPNIRSTDQLGVGIKAPYFITLGDHRDLTISPYLSPRTRTFEARYRQAFLAGDLTLNAAISADEIRPGETRSYVFARGEFDLGRDYDLRFGVEATSDPAYLLDYGYSDKDRLASFVALERVRGRQLLQADITSYTTLRTDERNATLPPLVGALSWERRYAPEGIGGQLVLGAGIEGFVRTGATTGPGGRDVARLGAEAGWQRDWIGPWGVLAKVEGQLALDAYAITDDPGQPDDVLRAIPAGAVTLRWPWVRAGVGGAVHVIEPVVSLGWSDAFGGTPPNEDSRLIEFDEANLHALTRFPGADRAETGTRAGISLGWTRIGPTGTQAALSVGQVIRMTPERGFSDASGLSGTASDWLVTGRLDLPTGFSLDGRTLLDPTAGFGKSEARVNWSGTRIDLAAAYVWLPEDAAEDRPAPISEWTVDAAYRIGTRWTVRADGRYDVAADQPARAGIGIGWQNECVTVDLSVSRRYTFSTTVEPATDFGLSVNLNGFSAGRSTSIPATACRN
jgi:LPS-assembly protein